MQDVTTVFTLEEKKAQVLWMSNPTVILMIGQPL